MKIIVICTGNTCRSQIAEGLLKNKYIDAEIYSAGTNPELHVNPYAVKAMSEEGYDISKHYPKLVNDFIDQEFDYVFQYKSYLKCMIRLSLATSSLFSSSGLKNLTGCPDEDQLRKRTHFG